MIIFVLSGEHNKIGRSSLVQFILTMIPNWIVGRAMKTKEIMNNVKVGETLLEIHITF